MEAVAGAGGIELACGWDAYYIGLTLLRAEHLTV